MINADICAIAQWSFTYFGVIKHDREMKTNQYFIREMVPFNDLNGVVKSIKETEHCFVIKDSIVIDNWIRRVSNTFINAGGHIIEKVIFNSKGELIRRCQYDYNADGSLKSQNTFYKDGELGEVILYEYNSLGEVIQIIEKELDYDTKKLDLNIRHYIN